MAAQALDARQIFLEAVEKHAPDQWTEFLDSACSGDAALRERVEELLKAHGQYNQLLDGEGIVATLDQPVCERPGTQIGPYKLLQQIGEGGFGVVYMAEQLEPVRRKVALKVIKPGMDTRQVIARFEAERQALAVMDHPNIAKVLDAGTTGERRDESPPVKWRADAALIAGRPYFVMELVRGIPITQYCDENSLPVRDRLELFATVCQAIQHAHTKGIIHRDIKPTNVLVTQQDGQPIAKVIDFGIAKAMGQQLTDKTLFTEFAQMIGTPLYMSPEQAAMSSVDVDTRSDIYSLGVLLYELLTGSTPVSKEQLKQANFDEIRRIICEDEAQRPSLRIGGSDTLPAIAAHRHVEPGRLSKLVRGELDWIVMKCLDKDRNLRYETAGSLGRDVERYLRDEPVQACPPSAWYRLRKIVRRHKGPVLAAALLILVLVSGIIGTTWGMLRATSAEALKEDALKDKVAALADAKDNLWRSLYEQARARRNSRQMGQRQESLDALAKAARLRPDERLRDEAIASMALPDVRLVTSPHAWPPGHFGGWGWSHDAQYRSYAHVSDQGVISLRSLPDDREIQKIDLAPTKFSGLLLSPDGRYLATVEAGNDTLRLWRVSDKKEMLRDVLPQTHQCAFSSDSQQLVVNQADSILRFDLATGQELNRWPLPDKRPVHHMAFHPDNRRLAVGYQSSNIVSIYDATNGDLVVHLPVSATHLIEQLVAWHPDGELLAVASSDPSIQIWNVAAKRKVATLEGHNQNVNGLSFHPGGNLLASASWDGSCRLWDPSTGRQLMQLPFSACPQFSSDGRWLGIVKHGEYAQLLEVTPQREYRTLVSSLGAGQGGYTCDGDISPDGRLLAQNMSDGVRLWHLGSGRELAVLPPGRPVFQNSGELLIVSPRGLERWPIQPGAGANEIRLGPPQTIALPAEPLRAARSQDGRTLAIVCEMAGMGLLVDLTTDSVRTPRLIHPQAGFVALSPDGRWMASGGWHSDRVRLWDAQTNQLAHEWITHDRAMVFFTPDSHVLIISRGDEFSFHDVETRNPVRPPLRRDFGLYPGHVAFSPDGRLMAMEMAPGVIHLKNAATSRTIAKLEDPHGDRADWMSFTPDGTKLVVTDGRIAKAIHIWNLRAIRQRLKGMNLDWEWPEFQPADEAAGRDAVPTIEVISAQPHYNRGIELASKGLVEESIAEFRKAIEIEPNFVSAYMNLGRALLAQMKPDEAITAYKKATEINPNAPWAYMELGRALLAQNRPDEAIASYRKATEINPNNSWAHIELGRALLAQNKPVEAIASYRKATEINPNDSWAHMQLGRVFHDLKKLDDAVVHYKRATEINPRDAYAHWNLGRALHDLGKLDDAVVHYKKATELNPDWPDPYFNLGVAQYRAGDWNAALQALEKSMRLRKGGDGNEWFFMAMAHWQLGNKYEAHKWHDRAAAWMEWTEKYQPKNDELLRIRAEAAELLRMNEKKD